MNTATYSMGSCTETLCLQPDYFYQLSNRHVFPSLCGKHISAHFRDHQYGCHLEKSHFLYPEYAAWPTALRCGTPAGLHHQCRRAPECSELICSPWVRIQPGLPGKDSMLSPAEKTSHHLLTQAAVLEEVLVLPERLGRSLKATTEPRMPSSRPHFKHNGRRSGLLWSGMLPFSSLLMYFQQPVFWRYPPPTFSAERDWATIL